MESLKFWRSENACETATVIQPPLIYGLPDDIALSCLARVPRKFHGILKCTSKRWRDLLCSEEWVTYRNRHNLHENWIYAFCRDGAEHVCCYVLDPSSSRRDWKLIDGIPPRSLKRKGIGFEVLGKKVFLLGGCGWLEDATDEVYCYDVSTNAWSQSASLSTPRSYFACEVLNGKLCAFGGCGLGLGDPHSWDSYNEHNNKWKSHRGATLLPDIEDSMVWDGKIYIRCGTQYDIYVIAYDPSNETWEVVDPDMASGWRGPAAVVDNRLYVLDESSGTRLMMWRKEIREWIAIGRLSWLLTRPPCRLVVIGTNIFVIGRGLGIVVIDVGSKGGCGVDGVMVTSSSSSSMPDLDGVTVISCKSQAI